MDKRNKLVRERKICLNCLSEGHGCKSCPSKFSCRTCSGRHHSLLHREREAPATTSTTPAPAMTSQAAAPSRGVASLYTAMVAFECGARTILARALLDAGAAIPIMTESLAASLGLPRRHDPIPVTGISGTATCQFTVTCNVYSVNLGFKLSDLTFTLIPSLEPVVRPADADKIRKQPNLQHFALADAELGGRVDLVLGISQLTSITTGTPFKVGDVGALPTQLGLCLSCPLSGNAPPAANTVTVNQDIPPEISKLWELDQVREAPTINAEERSALNQFDQSCKRIDGRYSVSLPRTESPPDLGDSRRQALSRLLANERSLQTRGHLSAFRDVVQEYFTLGHAEEVPIYELDRPSYYLPVHAVLKESSTSTKLRAVFDASARTSNGSSLNDQLLSGPNLYPPLPDVLIRFRCHPSAASADISKMFRGILLNAEEKDWHRFLYRANDGSIRDARMRRLTFGVKSSPFLATQVLRRHAQDNLESHPAAAQAVLSDFYVDDVLSGACNTNKAHDLFTDLRAFCAESGLDLRKWRTNDPSLRVLIPDHLLEPDTCDISASSAKALGVHWDTKADTLHVAIPDLPTSSAKVTKRTIASLTAGVFDVLGLFAPVVVSARILFQDTWRRGLSWDEEVPEDLLQRWRDWTTDLPIIHDHPIPRLTPIYSPSNAVVTLHGFCDASSVAYGAAIYARMEAPDSTIISLIVAKARVLPTRPVTVPKAELCGALLLARLMKKTLDLLQLPLHAAYTWTDSQIVLFWLPKAPSALNRFVANRVAAIQDLIPPERWRHVPTAENPADLASRGIRAHELLDSRIWWHGPKWLSLSSSNWPPPFRSIPSVSIYSVSIKPPQTLSPPQLAFISDLCTARASFFSLVRVLCYVYRFLHNTRHHRTQCLSGPLSHVEIQQAKSALYRLSQLESFSEAFDSARSDSPLPKGHPLRRFHVKLAPAGHLVVLSRVRNPDAPNTATELIPLSVRSALAKLLLSSLHRAYGHPGTSTLLAILSTSFIILGARNYLKGVSRQCVTCQRVLAQPVTQVMGLLPSVRTTPAPPFSNTGVDFAGPVTLRTGYTRKPVHLKCYIAVFVCMVTKAVHLELCETLSTADFMATFRRFVARRGCPLHVFSDNGSNFLGAAEEIRAIRTLAESEALKTQLINLSTNTDITWHNIPPRAPHFGGLWEAAVKAMKIGLRKIVTPHPLTWPELTTLLAEVEATLNSRPVAPLHADDLTENNVLTPGHFLIGRPLRAPPTKLPSTGKLSLLRRWNLVERLQADLWKHWSTSYLSSCAARSKWILPGTALQVGDIVLVKDESLRSRSWPLAIIEKLHSGDDGVSRVATISCRGKSYQRPVHRLVRLITDADEEQRTENSASLNTASPDNSDVSPPASTASDVSATPLEPTNPTPLSAPPGVCSGSLPEQSF